MKWPSLIRSSGSSRKDDDHAWPAYLFGGRVRTSTIGLVIAFVLTWWVYSANQPEQTVTPEAPTTQVVPPGFVPDPDYTWVPRTYVQEPLRTTTTTTTPTTTTTTTTSTEPADTVSPTDTTEPSISDTTDPSSTSESPTTFVDPDGAGPLPPTPVTVTTRSPAPASEPTSTTTAG